MNDRILKVNQLLKEEVSKLIAKDIEMPQGSLVTVTRVEAAPNLFQARVFVSVLPENKFEEAMRLLKRNVYSIQQKINRKLSMRPVPKIIFTEEKKTREAARIEELLDQLKKEEK